MPDRNTASNAESGEPQVAVTCDAYANEPIRFSGLQVVNLASEAAAVSEKYRNIVVSRVNGSCLRLAYLTTCFDGIIIRNPTNCFLFLKACSLSTLWTEPSCGLVRGTR